MIYDLLYGFQYFYYFITCLSAVYPDGGVEMLHEVPQFLFQGHLLLVRDDFVRSFHFDGYAVLEIYPLVVETDFLPVRGTSKESMPLLPATTSNCCL